MYKLMFCIFYSPLTYQSDMCEVIGDPVDHHKYPLNGVDRKQKRNKAVQRWDKHFGLGLIYTFANKHWDNMNDHLP